MPSRLNWPSSRLSAAISRSPWKTRIVTAVWLSSAVLKVCFRSAGIVVFFSTSLVITPPSVSMPSDSGVTSSSSTSCTSPASTPPWIAAPMATTSSGLTPLCGSLPNILVTSSCTLGMRVEPPTSTTSSISLGCSLASFRACISGPRQRSIRWSTSCSNLLRVMLICKCFGPLASAVMNGRLMSVVLAELSSFLAFSQASCKPLQGHRVLAQVDAVLLLELVGDVVDQHFVEVVAAQVRIAVGADHAEHAVGHFQHRDVERAAAQVEDHDLLVLFPIQAVGQGRGRRLVDDPRDFQPGDLAGVFGGLPLGVVEIGRHGDHGLVHLVAQVASAASLSLRRMMAEISGGVYSLSPTLTLT